MNVEGGVNMRDVIKFLNNNSDKVSGFEELPSGFLIHMKNGDTIEFYSESKLTVLHYKDDEND
jgi:hypothetical protein